MCLIRSIDVCFRKTKRNLNSITKGPAASGATSRAESERHSHAKGRISAVSSVMQSLIERNKLFILHMKAGCFDIALQLLRSSGGTAFAG